MKTNTLFLCVLLFSSLLFAQKQKDYLDLKSRYGFNVQRMTPVNFNLFFKQFPVSELPEVYLAAAIQNDALQFVKNGTEYFAEYQISFTIRSGKQTIYTNSWTEETSVGDFEKTNSRRNFQQKNYHITNLHLTSEEPAKEYTYECFLEVHDITSRNTHKLKQDINFIPADKDSSQISNIAFLETHPDSTEHLKLTPLTNSLEYNKPYFAFAQMMLPGIDSVTIEAELNQKQENAFIIVQKQSLKIKADSSAANIVYPLPFKKLEEGSYSLEFKWGKKRVIKEFSVVWFTKPIYLYKTDLASRPLRYLLAPAKYDSVNSLKLEEMDKWFTEFWKQQDQTPESNYNELLSEFYNRVDYTNRHFSVRSREGWETDRGRIYLLYGEPVKIENRRYATDSLPYMIWTYNDNLKFVFVDKSKNGEFFLIENEEEE